MKKGRAWVCKSYSISQTVRCLIRCFVFLSSSDLERVLWLCCRMRGCSRTAVLWRVEAVRWIATTPTPQTTCRRWRPGRRPRHSRPSCPRGPDSPRRVSSPPRQPQPQQQVRISRSSPSHCAKCPRGARIAPRAQPPISSRVRDNYLRLVSWWTSSVQTTTTAKPIVTRTQLYLP